MKTVKALFVGAFCIIAGLIAVNAEPIANYFTGPSPADVSQSVVKVNVGGGHGTGFYIGDGQVITAAHVAREAGADGLLELLLPNGVGVAAHVEWVDSHKDVALISIDPYALPTFPLQTVSLACGEPDAAVGTPVRSIGYPLSLNLVETWGRVSGETYREQGEDGQTVQIVDLRIAPGNSGGPVFDPRGRVIGLSEAMPIAHVAAEYGLVPSLIGLAVIVPRSVICRALTEEHVPFGTVAETPRTPET